MKRKSVCGMVVIAAATWAVSVIAAQADNVTVSLGQSAENFTLFGQGFSGQYGQDGTPLGSFTDAQGAATTDGSYSTFILSGLISSGSTGFSSGTYVFTTSYSGLDGPQGGPHAPAELSNYVHPNEFNYSALDPSTQMTLTLTTPSGVYDEPLVHNGKFVDGTNFSFAYVSPTCTGVSSCSQNNVGLTPGATEAGGVTISASFASPEPAAPVSAAPEPSSWLLMIAGLGAIGLTLRWKKKTAGFKTSGLMTA